MSKNIDTISNIYLESSSNSSIDKKPKVLKHTNSKEKNLNVDNVDNVNIDLIKNSCTEDNGLKDETKKRKRCFLDSCNNKLNVASIECKCGYKFCASHRLPELHKCEAIEKIRENAKELNTKILNKQKTVADKLKDRL